MGFLPPLPPPATQGSATVWGRPEGGTDAAVAGPGPAQEPLRWDMVYLVEPAAWEKIVYRPSKTTIFDATS